MHRRCSRPRCSRVPPSAVSGLTPIQYSLLSLVPAAGQCIVPALWGSYFARQPRHALCAAPLGLLLGLLVMAAGLAVKRAAGDNFDPFTITLVVAGVCASVLCKAGLQVLQHASVALVLPRALVLGLCLQAAPRGPRTRAAPRPPQSCADCR